MAFIETVMYLWFLLPLSELSSKNTCHGFDKSHMLFHNDLYVLKSNKIIFAWLCHIKSNIVLIVTVWSVILGPVLLQRHDAVASLSANGSAKKAALPLAKILVTASCRSSKTSPRLQVSSVDAPFVIVPVGAGDFNGLITKDWSDCLATHHLLHPPSVPVTR